MALPLAGIAATTDHSTTGSQDDSFAKFGQEFEGKIAKSYEDSKEWWPSTPKPPPGTPNAIIFLLDDTGFAHLGSFGGLIDTPNIEFDFVETEGLKQALPGGKGELYINGIKVGEVDMPEMHISTFSLSETFDVGIDAGTPVSDKYRVKNRYPFTGELDKVVVKLTD